MSRVDQDEFVAFRGYVIQKRRDAILVVKEASGRRAWVPRAHIGPAKPGFVSVRRHHLRRTGLNG